MMSHLKDFSGFTLLELLVTTAIAIALGAGGFVFFANQTRSLADQSATLDAAEGARAAFDFMAKDIRSAGGNPGGGWSGGTCNTGLSTPRTDTLTIKSDSNGDGSISADETTTYTYDAGTKSITRTNNNTTETLIKNVNSFSLQYYVGTAAAATSGSPAQVTNADCDKVTSVLVTLQVRTPKTLTINQMNLSARVALRNRSTVLKRLGQQTV